MKKKHQNNTLWRYAGLTGQLIVGLLLFMWLGSKFDGWLKFSFPLGIWILPLIFITAVIIKIIIDTGKKDNSQ